MLEQKLCGLESSGKLLMGRLTDHAWTSESDHGLRFGQGDVTQGSKARHDTGRRRICQDSDVGKPCFTVTCECAAGLGHLHQRENSLVHAGTSGGADDNDGALGLCGGLDRAGDLLAHHRAHRCGQEREIHHRQADGVTPHLSGSGDHCVNQAGFLAIGHEAILVGRHSLEAKGIDRHHGRVTLLKGPLVHQRGDPLMGSHREVVPAFWADTHVLLDG